MASRDDPRRATAADVSRVIVAGREVRVMVIGAGTLFAQIRAALRNPRHPLMRGREGRPMRLAFGVFDRIRTGEIPVWGCALCAQGYEGLGDLSCIGVADHEGDRPEQGALIAVVCGACDQISSQDTIRRLHQMFGLEDA